MGDLKVSISYSWDNEEHKKWVRKLADYLIVECGIDVTLDQYDLTAGKNMQYFMETAIEKADKVLIILTPNYKLKADSRASGVGYEHSIISTNLFEAQIDNTKFIPILRSGSNKESSPVFIKSLIHHDMTKDDRFESDAFTLAQILYDQPAVSKPAKGNKPDLTQIVDPILEQAKHLAIDIDNFTRRDAFSKSYSATQKIADELGMLFKAIKEKAIEYKDLAGLFITSDYDGHRVILNINGIGLRLEYKHYTERQLNPDEVVITIWTKRLLFGQGEYYLPFEEPKLLWSRIFKPKFNNELEISWSNNKEQLSTKGLNGYCYSRLFEFVREKRT